MDKKDFTEYIKSNSDVVTKREKILFNEMTSIYEYYSDIYEETSDPITKDSGLSVGSDGNKNVVTCVLKDLELSFIVKDFQIYVYIAKPNIPYDDREKVDIISFNNSDKLVSSKFGTELSKELIEKYTELFVDFIEKKNRN